MLVSERHGEVLQLRMSRVIGGEPVYWVAAYLVDGLLVDTGCAHTAVELLDALEREGATVRVLVNTHHHEDHIGANRLVRECFGADLFAHPEAVPLIAAPPRLPFYRETVWGQPEPSVPSPLRPRPAEILTSHHRFLALDTPGHSPGHLALLEPEVGWCFTGDLFIGERPRVVWKETDVGAWLRSLDLLLALAPPGGLTLFTGPGPVVADARRALEDCAAYLRDLGATARRLAAEGLWDPRPCATPSSGGRARSLP